MKRTLLIGIGIFLFGALGLQLGQMSFAASSSEDLLSLLFSDSNVEESDPKDAKELENLAANEEAPFENLYLFMFQNVTRGPSDAAVAELSKRLKEKRRRDYSEEELRQIVTEGSLEPIINKMDAVASEISEDETFFETQTDNQAAADAAYAEFKSENELSENLIGFYDWYYATYVKADVLDNDDLIAIVPTQNVLEEYQYLLDLYQNELDLQQEYRRYAYESLADEMFFNNDLNDSADIDILHDLDQAYYVLFGSTITYPDRSSGPALELASDEPEPQVEPDPEVELSSDASDETEINPYTCFDDEGLRAAVEEYNLNPSESAPESGSGLVYPSLEDDTDEGTEGESPKEAVDRALQELDGFVAQLSTQGDWTRSLPCGDIFCITIELVEDTEDPTEVYEYEETDNCVFCHLTYINQHMEQTLNKSLVTGKAPMNIFEDATCKEAGSMIDLDFNVFTIAMPIELDPGDDIDEAPEKNISDLKNTLISFGAFPNKDKAQTELGKTLADLECESLFNLSDAAGTSATLDSARADCAKAAAGLKATVDAAIETILFEAEVGDSHTLFEQASAEFSKMLLIFKNIQEGLQATYVTETAPLSKILAKNYCPQ